MGKVFAVKVGPEFESPKHIKTTVEGICNLSSPTVRWRGQMGELEEATRLLDLHIQRQTIKVS